MIGSRREWQTTQGIRALWTALAGVLVLMAAMALAPQQAEAQGRPLLIVPFERDNIDDIFFQTLMDRARGSASGAAEYVTLDPVDSTLADLLFAVGCADPSVECMQLVAESFGAEVILHGKVWGNDRGIYLEVHLFDAQLGSELIDEPIERSFASEDKELLLKMAVGEIQQVFYPFTGEISINSVEPSTTILFDGAEVGNTSEGPVKLTGVKLGEHQVTARKDDAEVTEVIVLLHDTPMDVTLDPNAQSTTNPVVGGDDFDHVGSVIAFSVGGAAMLTGVIFSALVDAQNAEAERLGKLDVIPGQEARDVEQAGGRFETLQFVFYGVGAAALATGAVLFFLEGSDEAPATGSWISPLITEDGVGASVGGRF